jgi:hypothetical protein
MSAQRFNSLLDGAFAEAVDDNAVVGGYPRVRRQHPRVLLVVPGVEVDVLLEGEVRSSR